MPKIKCPCNNIISLSGIPNDDEWLLVSDTDFSPLLGYEINTDIIYENMKHVIVCPICKRLLIFWDGLNSSPMVYIKEGIREGFGG